MLHRYVKVAAGLAFVYFALLLPGFAGAQVSLVSPTGGQTLSGSTSIKVSVTSNVSWVNFYVDGYALGSSPPYSIDWDTTLDLNGTHFVEARAYDSGGALIGTDEITVMVSNSPTPAPTPTPTGYFGTLRPKATLPSESTCSSKVLNRSSSEAIPANTTANHIKPTAQELSTFHALPLWNSEAPTGDFSRVDGNFTGTTDQIIRWGACKWGLDENAMRAEAWDETNWIQSTYADRRTDYSQCHTPDWDGWDGTQCWQSYGIFQAKVFDYNIWPEVRDSTAFNSDFRAAYIRSCLNGDISYLRDKTPEPGYPSYPTSDLNYMFWGCMGQWASGGWFDVGGIEYMTTVRRIAHASPWPSSNAQNVTITQPSNGANVSGAVSIATRLSAAAAWVNVYIDGAYLGSSPPDTFSWNSNGAKNGAHSISARAFNSVGQQIGSTSISVNVVQPTDWVAITAPSNGSTVSGTVEIATQSGGGVLWENMYIDNVFWSSSPPYSGNWDSTSVTDGQHTILVRGYSAKGTLLTSASINVDVANGVPVKITKPLAGDNIRGVASIVTQVAPDVAWEDIYVDSSYLASSPPYTFSWNSARVPNGTHTLSAKAYGSTGRTLGTASVSVKVGN